MMARILHNATSAFIRIVPLWVILSKPFQLFLYHVYYRVFCPGSGVLVRDCIASGNCGCDNSPAEHHHEGSDNG